MARQILTTMAFALGGCSAGPIETLAPKDAAFEVSCSDGCGQDGRSPTVAIDVRFGAKYVRNFSVCCSERASLLAQLVRIRDEACAGQTVAPVTIGTLTVGTTRSQLSGKIAATLDQGHGYVAFQCDAWLPRLIAEVETAACCTPPAPSALPSPSGAASAASSTAPSER